MKKDEWIAEMRVLEEQAFNLISDDERQAEFDKVIERTRELRVIAKNKGWL